VTGIRARPARPANRRTRKQAARITFTVNRPGRVVFVVRGPAPSCQVAARFSIRADRGVNHVRFTGRVGRRDLPYGTYRITARTRGGAPSRPVVVVVGERRGGNGFVCASASRASADPFAEILGIFAQGTGPTAIASEGSPAAQATSTAENGAKEKGESGSGVLPAVSERLRKVPEALPKLSGSDSPNSIVGMGALLLLIVSGLALVLYVVRFFRRPHAM
jgi:hypothetical protein